MKKNNSYLIILIITIVSLGGFYLHKENSSNKAQIEKLNDSLNALRRIQPNNSILDSQYKDNLVLNQLNNTTSTFLAYISIIIAIISFITYKTLISNIQILNEDLEKLKEDIKNVNQNINDIIKNVNESNTKIEIVKAEIANNIIIETYNNYLNAKDYFFKLVEIVPGQQVIILSPLIMIPAFQKYIECSTQGLEIIKPDTEYYNRFINDFKHHSGKSTSLMKACYNVNPNSDKNDFNSLIRQIKELVKPYVDAQTLQDYFQEIPEN